VFEAVLVKVLGYGVFWSSHTRQRFRALVLQWILVAENFLVYFELRPLPRAQGERLVQRRISIFGITVFVRRYQRTKYRVALLVDEFFGAWETAIGGYGALARKYICRFVPNDDIEMDVLLDNSGGDTLKKLFIDNTMLCRLPSNRALRQRWLSRQAYNLFLSIEMTEPSFNIVSQYEGHIYLLYWIQDPRDLKLYQSRLCTVTRLRDSDWAYVEHVTDWIQELIERKSVSFISQGESLSEIARGMYRIPESETISVLPNPVEIDENYELNDPPKENKIIFLGRLEAQKRVWIFCETAKLMPEYEFYILGATAKSRNEDANVRTLSPYRNSDGTSKIRNLHFTGHVDGELKAHHIQTAKLLLNTSIWEGIPVSWLEALSYGTLIVASFDRDRIVERFGTFVGEVLGDGTDEANLKKFGCAIEYWMNHDAERNAVAEKAIEYVRSRHSIPVFAEKMRNAILGAVP
jgi:glycosyltransferase involved in cell wall biosynthesis